MWIIVVRMPLAGVAEEMIESMLERIARISRVAHAPLAKRSIDVAGGL